MAEEGQLLQQVKRLMPTVGCEADAVAFTSEDRVTTVDPSGSQPGPVCLQDGSYSIPADFTSGSRWVCAARVIGFPSICDNQKRGPAQKYSTLGSEIP